MEALRLRMLKTRHDLGIRQQRAKLGNIREGGRKRRRQNRLPWKGIVGLLQELDICVRKSELCLALGQVHLVQVKLRHDFFDCLSHVVHSLSRPDDG